MGCQRHQLDHMQIICTSLQTNNHASTSSLNFLQAERSSWLKARKVTLHAFQIRFWIWLNKKTLCSNSTVTYVKLFCSCSSNSDVSLQSRYAVNLQRIFFLFCFVSSPYWHSSSAVTNNINTIYTCNATILLLHCSVTLAKMLGKISKKYQMQQKKNNILHDIKYKKLSCRRETARRLGCTVYEI